MSKAFKCLSDEGSRRQYDQIGIVDDLCITSNAMLDSEGDELHVTCLMMRFSGHSLVRLICLRKAMFTGQELLRAAREKM